MKTKLITLLFLYPLLSFCATNSLYKNSEVVTYWNPTSGGMMITESNVTRKVDFLYGRNYVKELIRLGWSNINPNAPIIIETKTNVSIVNENIPLTTKIVKFFPQIDCTYIMDVKKLVLKTKLLLFINQKIF